MAITKIQTGGIPDASVTHAKLHGTMDLTGKTVTLPSIDMGSNNITTTGKVIFSNIYAQVADLPSASTYHGMFAHVHATGKAYYAHAGAWIVLANDADKLNLSGGALTGEVTSTNVFKAHSSSSGDYVRMYGGSGTGKWDIYGNGANLRFSDNESSGIVAIDTGATFGGNVGIGTAGYGTYRTGDRVIGLGSGSTIRSASGGSDPYITIANNAFHDASAWKYIHSDYASSYEQYNAAHVFNVAASGSAAGTVSFSEAMRITATGDVGIGAANPGGSRLYLQDNHTTDVTNAATMIGNTTLTINGNSGEGSDVLRMGPMSTLGAYFIDVSNSGGSAPYSLLLNPISGGRVGIGETAPTAKLHITGESTNGAVGLAKIQHTATHSYSPTSFIGVGRSLDLISNSNNNNDVSGIRLSNSTGSRETFVGVVQAGGQGDFVVQGYNGSGYLETFRISSAGRVTMPNQPSANVFANAGNAGAYNNTSTNSYVIATGIRHNIGNHYNTSNGRFTCPVAGRYYVSFSGNWYNTGGAAWLRPQIRKNGTTQTQHYETTSMTWHHLAASTILNCAVGDYLQIYNNTQNNTGGGTDVGAYSQLTFHLMG